VPYGTIEETYHCKQITVFQYFILINQGSQSFQKNFFLHIGSTTILNVKDNCSHLNIFMRNTRKKSNRFLLVAAERPVARDVAGNSALRPVMAQPILPGHKKN
jgi:hypothetical protein